MDLQYLIVVALILGAIIFAAKTLVQKRRAFRQNLVAATIAVAISNAVQASPQVMNAFVPGCTIVVDFILDRVIYSI